ncbi:hypothetical protein WJX82_005878 [Trebouxia sp. C0006]
MANDDIPQEAAHIPLSISVRVMIILADMCTGKGRETNSSGLRCLWPSSHTLHDSAEEFATSEPFLQSKPSQLIDSCNAQPSSLLLSQEVLGAPEQAHQLYGSTGPTVEQPASTVFTGVDVGDPISRLAWASAG